MAGLEIHPTTEALMLAAAAHVIAAGAQAIQTRGRFSVALAGGSTPEALYRLLAAEPFVSRLDWRAVHVFWGDERSVPPDHSDSNYRMARESLLAHVPVAPENIHRIQGEIDAAQAALAYEDALRAHFAGPPRFDLILLGMGEDGHTASLFPGAPALAERVRLAVPVHAAHLGSWRVTLTYPVLNAAAAVLFVVSGSSKAATLRAVLEGPSRPTELPAQGVRPHAGRLMWLADASAAEQLAGGNRSDSDGHSESTGP